MINWTKVYVDPKSGAKVNVSTPAFKILGPDARKIFIKRLVELMVHLEADQAYVSKCGVGLAIHLHWSCRHE